MADRPDKHTAANPGPDLASDAASGSGVQPDTPYVDTLHVEERVFRPHPRTLIEAGRTAEDMELLQAAAAADPLGYWEDAARELDWFSPWNGVLDDSDPPRCKWFPGATTNIAYNALDRHIRTAAKNRLALIWEGEPGDTRKYTYFELYREVNRLAAALRSLGVVKGDHVVICMPLLPETAVAMLACAKIGAVHCLVFPGYSAKVLRQRIQSLDARCLVTADGFYRNGRVINVKELADEALSEGTCTSLEMVIVVRRSGINVEMSPSRDVWYHDLIRRQKPVAETEVMDAEDPLFVLHTSGATGEPRAMVHTHGGYQVGVHRTLTHVFDLKPTDIYWCTADLGWITGHSYVLYGPLLAGATTVLYEGHPLYPQADRIWRIVENLGVTILYGTPTLFRMVRRHGTHLARQSDISSLRLLATVGEPINPETWLWLYTVIGRERCPVLDTWWQTETGQFMISPLPVQALKPGSVGKPLPGIAADVIDAYGNPTPPGQGGFLVITRPWPAMFRTIAGNPELYGDSFATDPSFAYVAGDLARKDEDGYFWIQGRADDVINIAGHRLGTTELENALTSHRQVAEAAVIAIPDKIKGNVAKAFIVLADPADASEDLAREIKNHMRKELGPIAVLRAVEFRDTLPKTRSGKIMRRLLRAEELGEDPGDLSALESD